MAAGAPPSIQIGEGLLRTRDLVELYYQGRVAVQVIEHDAAADPDGYLLLKQDSRRIRYEIIVNNNTAAGIIVQIGSRHSLQSLNYAAYAIPPNSTQVIIRDFRSDLEGVTYEQLAAASVAGTDFAIRETILTPLPVDEVP